ncbi:MAG: hypothetical protein ACOYT9_03045 [Patescibacteria group bacterium]
MATVEKHSVLIMFGGIAPEHEVSIISGLQIAEHLDKSKYIPQVLYVTKKGEFHFIGELGSKKDFLKKRRENATFGRDEKGGYIQLSGIFGQKIYPIAAFLAFHGGLGEGGALQGLLESVGIPFTSSGVEGSVLTMNKQLTKQLVKEAGIATVPGICVDTFSLREKYAQTAKESIALLGLPLIIKPAHLGSSIGISVAHNEGDLKRMLLEASYLDSELVIETFIPKYVEYNCSVRMQNGVLETSEIERPMGKDEILSFEDKYKKGAKKTGGSGMASLTRELPAKISDQLKTTIQNFAKKAYVACRCKGLVRIDFMAAEDGNLYLTEINPIPGSLAFYLWEATGIQFKQQITDAIEQSIKDAATKRSYEIDYTTDIVEKFIKGS